MTFTRTYSLADVSRGDWVAWAKEAGYDPDLVLAEVNDIFPKVAEELPQALIEAGFAGEDLKRAQTHARQLEASLPKAHSASAPKVQG